MDDQTAVSPVEESEVPMRAGSTDKDTLRGSGEDLAHTNGLSDAISKKEKELDVEKGDLPGEPPMTFPDGGFRAWLVALGVSDHV